MCKRKVFFLFCVLFGNAALLFSQQNPPNPLLVDTQPFDVLLYDAEIEFPNPAPSRTIVGKCDISVRWKENPAGKHFYFHLLDIGVDSVFENGKPTTAEKIDGALPKDYCYAISPTAATLQDTSIFTVYYSGNMTAEAAGNSWGGVHASGGTLYAMGVGFSASYVSTTRHWLPCFDHPSDKAEFRGKFTVKNGQFVASNGELKSVVPGDETTTFVWEHSIPCATYLLTFSSDVYVPLSFGDVPAPMTVYSKPRDTTATKISFRLLPRMAKMLEGHFGAYPYEKIGYCNTPLGAMEHQTMISYPISLAQSRDTVNSVAAHELAHQWFGNLVSSEDFRHAWLSESFATFCESLWMEELRGFSGGYLHSQTQKISRYINTVSKNEGLLSLYDFSRTPPSSNYPVTIYEKGAVVVGLLRHILGDETLFAGLRVYLQRHRYGTAATEDIKNILEEASGRELDDFFNEWVYGKGYPKIRASFAAISQSGKYKKVRADIVQTQPAEQGTYTELPVEIGFRDAETNEFRWTIATMRGSSLTVELDSIPLEHNLVSINSGPSVRVLMQVEKIEDITGIDENKQTTQTPTIQIMPNPVHGELSIEADENTAITVVDLEGKTLWESPANFQNKRLISTVDWPEGVYYAMASKGGAKTIVPVVVVR